MSYRRLIRFASAYVAPPEPPPPTPWTPAAIPTAFWIDASDPATVTLNGSTVSQINDKSTNNRHATQSSPTSQPTLTTNAINSRSVLNFVGATDQLQLAGATNIIQNVSYAALFAVLRCPNVIPNQTIFNIPNNSSTGTMFSARINGVGIMRQVGRRLFADAVAIADSASNTVANDEVFLYEAIQDYTVPEIRVFKNGTQVALQSSFGTVGQTSNTACLDAIYIGSLSNSTVYYGGVIGEFIFVTSALSTLDRQRIEGYLAHRWGLAASLPVGHPFLSSPPTI